MNAAGHSAAVGCKRLMSSDDTSGMVSLCENKCSRLSLKPPTCTAHSQIANRTAAFATHRHMISCPRGMRVKKKKNRSKKGK